MSQKITMRNLRLCYKNVASLQDEFWTFELEIALWIYDVNQLQQRKVVL